MSDYQSVKAKGTPYDPIIQRTADAYGVPYALMHKQLFNESSFDPNAKSPTGPRGLAQMTKLTGNAYGLQTDEDFYDPEKSIDAMGRHMRDLLKTYDGDQLKAALAYNQGQGKLGSPQLAALSRGDLSGVSEEGRNYMAKLSDVAESPFKDLVSKGITPKSQPLPFDQLSEGVRKAPKVQSLVGSDVPMVTGLGFAGKEAPKVDKTFAQLSYEQKGSTIQEDDDKSTWFGTSKAVDAEVATGPLGMAYRAAKTDTGPALIDQVLSSEYFNTQEWSREELDKIRNAGVKPQFYGVITGGKSENIDDLIKLALENQQYERDRADAGTGGKIVAGFVGAAVDPVTYTPFPGMVGAKLISKVAVGAAYGAATSVASEAGRSIHSGLNVDYQSALIGGALLGGGMSFAMDRLAAAFRKNASAPPEPTAPLEGDFIPGGGGNSGPGVNFGAPKIESHLDGEFSNVNLIEGRKAIGQDRLRLEGPPPNDFAGQAMRLEARETARNTGEMDRSRMPVGQGDEVVNMDGLDVANVPGDSQAVRTLDGSIYSGGNPLNPRSRMNFQGDLPPTDGSNWGFTLGGFTEIGLTLGRTESIVVRDLASDLVRSPTGNVSGSNGKFGATATDIVERLHGQNNRSYNKVHNLLEELMDDPAYALSGGLKSDKMANAFRNVVEDIEASWNPTFTSKLTAKEKELKQALQDHFQSKLDMLENPSQFGNPGATSVLKGTRHAGAYVPNVYSLAAKQLWTKTLGGREGLKEGIKRSWMTSYASRPHVKARVDKALTEDLKAKGIDPTPVNLKKALDDYAEQKAHGVSNDESFSSSGFEDNMSGIAGLENNSFLEARHLFDSDMPITLRDGSQFAVNDLRDFNYAHIMPAYDRRIDGDIAIMGSTGRDTAALKQRVLDLEEAARTPQDRKEVAALQQVLKMVTGRARRDPEGAFGTLVRALTDLSFVVKNAYMGIQGIGEVASLVTKGHVHMVLKGVPILRDIAMMGSKIKPKELKEMHALVFGKELDDLIRPTRGDLVQRLRDNGSKEWVAQSVGTVKAGTGWLAAKWPMSRFLVESTNYLMDAGRQGVLSELVNHTLDGKRSKLFTKDLLKGYSLTKEQFADVQQLVRDHIETGPDGNFKLRDGKAFQSDPRTMDLWRIGDRIADQTMLRPHKLSNQDTKAYGPGVALMMQFKKFVIKSMNGRMVRAYMDATKNGQKVDQMLQAVIASGLAMSVYMAQKHLQALTVPEGQRKAFLDQAMNPSTLAYAAISRSSHIGAPFGLANVVTAPLGFDQAAMVRTSILPKSPKEKQGNKGAMKYRPTSDSRIQDAAGRVLDQVPGAGFVFGAGQAAYNAAGLAVDSKNNFTDTEYMTGMYNGMRNIVPNDPVTQSLLLKLFNDQGIELK